jgi:hypothetical protein
MRTLRGDSTLHLRPCRDRLNTPRPRTQEDRLKTRWKITVFIVGLGGFIAALTTVAKNSYDFLDAYWKLKQGLGFEEPTVN